MSSTDLDAPPLKSILIAILVVLGLHVLTAVALVAIKPSTPKTPLSKQTPPIEIELVTLPAELPEETIETVKPVEVKKMPSPKPVPAAKPKPVAEVSKPVVQKQKAEVTPQPKVEKPVPVTKEPVADKLPTKKPIKQEKQQPDIDKTFEKQQAEQRRIVAAQAEKAAQEAANQARAKALQDDIQKANAKAARDAQAQAEANAKAAKDAAEAKAAKQAEEAAARAKAEADAKAAATASNEPVNFTASAANWASAPNFSFPDRAARRARSGDTLNVVLVLRVNKQGGIDSVRVAQTSGNAALDKEAARQVRSGKFKPFTKNGAPVVGNVTLPVAYNVP